MSRMRGWSGRMEREVGEVSERLEREVWAESGLGSSRMS